MNTWVKVKSKDINVWMLPLIYLIYKYYLFSWMLTLIKIKSSHWYTECVNKLQHCEGILVFLLLIVLVKLHAD